MDDRRDQLHPTGTRRQAVRPLTPEEEGLPDADDDYDDTLPADLWFHWSPRQIRPDRATV